MLMSISQRQRANQIACNTNVTEFVYANTLYWDSKRAFQSKFTNMSALKEGFAVLTYKFMLANLKMIENHSTWRLLNIVKAV